MNFLLGSTEYEVIDHPNWQDAQDAKDGSFSVELRRPVPGPAITGSRIGLIRNASGVQAKGIYDSLTVGIEGTTRKYSATFLSGYFFCQLKFFRVNYSGDANDVLRNMITDGGQAAVQFLGIPEIPFSQEVEVQAVGEYLAAGLDKLCAQIGYEWRVKIDTWALELYDPNAPTTGTDITFPLPCDPGKQVASPSYVAHFDPASVVVVAGKNADLSRFDALPVPSRTETTVELLQEGDPKRHFELLAGATSIISVEVTGGVAGFTVSISPSTQDATDGTADEITYTITVTAFGGFAGDVDLSFSGLSGVTAVFDDPTIVGGSGTTTLRLTPTDSSWTDADPNEEGTFTVLGEGPGGTPTASDTAELTISAGVDCCDSFDAVGDDTGRPVFSIDFTSDSACEFHYFLDVFAGDPGMTGDTGGTETTPFTANFTMDIDDAQCIDVHVWCGPGAPVDPMDWPTVITFLAGSCA